jgi:hypothetical protein
LERRGEHEILCIRCRVVDILGYVHTYYVYIDIKLRLTELSIVVVVFEKRRDNEYTGLPKRELFLDPPPPADSAFRRLFYILHSVHTHQLPFF